MPGPGRVNKPERSARGTFRLAPRSTVAQAAVRMLVLPFRIETLYPNYPYANWAVMTATLVAWLALWLGVLPAAVVKAMILHEDGWTGWLGHVLLHVGWLHLGGNLIFLWVFGNAVCATVNNLGYLGLYVGAALAGALGATAFGELPTVGASGAINGVVGVAVAFFPLNRVHLWWWLFVRAGTVPVPLWAVALAWFAFDVWGAAARTDSGVAYGAHLAGFVFGLAAGLVLLATGTVRLTQWDNRSLWELLRGSGLQR